MTEQQFPPEEPDAGDTIPDEEDTPIPEATDEEGLEDVTAPEDDDGAQG